jgi:hypothetical protein
MVMTGAGTVRVAVLDTTLLAPSVAETTHRYSCWSLTVYSKLDSDRVADVAPEMLANVPPDGVCHWYDNVAPSVTLAATETEAARPDAV